MRRRVMLGASVLTLVAAAGIGALVRAEPPAGHFTINADDTVTDEHTGLVWQRTITSTTYDYTQASAYCTALTIGTRSDWRLPTVAELQTIVDDTRASPAIDTTVFPSAPTALFLTGTWYFNNTDLLWYVDFDDGRLGVSGTPAGRVRCVH